MLYSQLAGLFIEQSHFFKTAQTVDLPIFFYLFIDLFCKKSYKFKRLCNVIHPYDLELLVESGVEQSSIDRVLMFGVAAGQMAFD